MQWTTRTWIWKVMMWRDTSASSTQISQTVFVCTIMHKNVFFGHFCFLLLFLMMMMIPVLCCSSGIHPTFASSEITAIASLCYLQGPRACVGTEYIFYFICVHCLPIHCFPHPAPSLPPRLSVCLTTQSAVPCFSVCMHCMSLDSCLSSDRDITTLWLWLVSAISGQINLRKDT